MMIETIIPGIITGVIANITTDGFGKVFSRQSQMVDAAILSEFVNTRYDSRIEVSHSNAILIKEKLSSEPILQLSSAYIVAKVVTQADQEQLETIKNAILDCLDRNPIKSVPVDVIHAYWQLYVDYMVSAADLPRMQSFLLGRMISEQDPPGELTSRENALLENVSHFVPRYQDLIINYSLLKRLDSFGSAIKSATLENYQTLTLEHSIEVTRRKFNQLYVNRTLRSKEGEVSSDDTLGHGRVVRAAITGDPGGGKSTLMRHLMILKSTNSSSREVPVFVRLREVSPNQDLLNSSITRAVRRDTQLDDLTDGDIQNLSTAGRLFIIFDGLDEMPSIPDRRLMVEQIQRYSNANPLTSILVTSRQVGYEVTSLDPNRFQHYELTKFNKGQISEYLDRWFVGDVEQLRDSFERESNEVSELLHNPLMLSLLCTLYKVRGTIPRTRLKVYKSCADLLFNRWDNMRQIDLAPEDHHLDGEFLMQELAYFFYSNKSTQKGIESTLLRDIIAKYLMNSNAILRNAAERRAQIFLDFCSGRAWLLVCIGTTPTGETLFEFVHQTFMEYFAAEYISREDWDVDRYTEFLTNQFERNSSSVLIDLLVSALHSSKRSAIPRIIQRMNLKRDKQFYLPLMMRIISAAPVGPTVVDGVLVDALNSLLSSSSVLSSFTSIMEMPSELKSRACGLICGFEETNSDGLKFGLMEIRQRFLECTSWYSINTISGSNIEEWEAEYNELKRIVIEVDKCQSEFIALIDIAHYGERVVLRPSVVSWAVQTPMGDIVGGLLTIVLRRLMTVDEAIGNSSYFDAYQNISDRSCADILALFEGEFKPVGANIQQASLVEAMLFEGILDYDHPDLPVLSQSERSLAVNAVLIVMESSIRQDDTVELERLDWYGKRVGIDLKDVLNRRMGASSTMDSDSEHVGFDPSEVNVFDQDEFYDDYELEYSGDRLDVGASDLSVKPVPQEDVDLDRFIELWCGGFLNLVE